MKRHLHSLSHRKALSADMGELVPIGYYEVLPGDSIQQATTMLLRLAPMLSPMFAQVQVKLHHWYVPWRVVWPEFEQFITGGPTGDDTTVAPTISLLGASNAAIGTLADYLGVPTGNNITVSALPFRAYASIFNNWYRDENLVTAVGLATASGPDATTNTTLQKAAWEKDYFTSSRTSPQLGTAVTIPLGTSAPVGGIGISPTSISPGGAVTAKDAVSASTSYTNAFDATNHNIFMRANTSGAAARPNVIADLSAVPGVSVNTLRQALAIQRFQEARARYGHRYPEYLAYLGVKSSDGRLQLPEYLGGGRQVIQVSEVLATAESTGVKIGDMKGHGISSIRTNRYRRFFEEHGCVITLMHVQPRTQYMQGLHRSWSRDTRFKYWHPEYEHIGQQEVLNKEIYAPHATPDGVFGYQDRYDEYRRIESSIHGEFRSTLDYWHMARIFTADPALNSTFVTSVPTKRTFAVTTNDIMYCMVNHSIQARRLVSKRANSFIF